MTKRLTKSPYSLQLFDFSAAMRPGRKLIGPWHSGLFSLLQGR